MKKTHKRINGLRSIDRHHLDRDLIDGQVLYEIEKWMKHIIKVRVNNVTIPITIVKNFSKRYIDISYYVRHHPEVKNGIISIWVDTEKDGDKK